MTKMETLKVLLTGAAGQIGYCLAPMIARGDAFGPNYKVQIVMLDLPVCVDVMKGVALELEDCASPYLAGVEVTGSQEDAFKDIDVAILVAGAVNLKEGMKRSDLLEANRKIYEEQARLLDTYAKKTCKVLVVANPANTNCCILTSLCKNIPKENFSCLTRLDFDRSRSMLARKIGVSCEQIKNTHVWGNHSSSMVPDCQNAVAIIEGKGEVKVMDLIESKWVEDHFIPEVKERSAAVIAYRKRSSACSAATATCKQLYNWFNGTPGSEWVSMGVCSDGSYGVPEGIVFAFPVTIKDGKWSIVQGLKLTAETKENMKKSADELEEEKKMAFA